MSYAGTCLSELLEELVTEFHKSQHTLQLGNVDNRPCEIYVVCNINDTTGYLLTSGSTVRCALRSIPDRSHYMVVREAINGDTIQLFICDCPRSSLKKRGE